MASAPKVFFSYSHDSEAHKNWVLGLATRLVSNGVDVILDQWDLNLGSDLPRFMEQDLSSAKRVISICTAPYVRKANEGLGGVGYEKMILTAQLMRDINSASIIPVVRDNGSLTPVPTFLASRLYIDFRDNLAFEAKYAELISDIHDQKIKPRPPLGKNPFEEILTPTTPILSFGAERFVSPAMAGIVSFDYSNNNGRFTFGAGDMAFETVWSRAGGDSIHAYTDAPSIHSVGIALGASEITEIQNASQYDTSSRVRTPHIGEILVWKNTAGYFLATKIMGIKVRNPGKSLDEICIEYKIAFTKSSDFTK